MMKIEFIDFWSIFSPLAFFDFSVPMPRIIACATCSLVRDQMSTTLL